MSKFSTLWDDIFDSIMIPMTYLLVAPLLILLLITWSVQFAVRTVNLNIIRINNSESRKESRK